MKYGMTWAAELIIRHLESRHYIPSSPFLSPSLYSPPPPHYPSLLHSFFISIFSIHTALCFLSIFSFLSSFAKKLFCFLYPYFFIFSIFVNHFQFSYLISFVLYVFLSASLSLLLAFLFSIILLNSLRLFLLLKFTFILAFFSFSLNFLLFLALAFLTFTLSFLNFYPQLS